MFFIGLIRLSENVTILFLTAKIRKKDENTKGCGNFFYKYVVKARCPKPYNLTILQPYNLTRNVSLSAENMAKKF